MTIILEQHPIPETGAFEIRRSVTIHVPASEARRKVSSWLTAEVSYMLLTEEPTLVVGERALWRVPAVLTAPHVGHVGVVGSVDVDAETGKMADLDTRKAEILAQARELAATLPPYTRRSAQDLPAEAVADLIPATRIEPQQQPPDIIRAARHRQSR